jgi:hypothetical protein
MTADFMTRARARPDRRMEIILPSRRTVAIAGYLRQSKDAIVVRRETALCISFTVTAAEAR